MKNRAILSILSIEEKEKGTLLNYWNNFNRQVPGPPKLFQ